MEKPWQNNKITIIAAYSLEYLSHLRVKGEKPGMMRVTIDKGTADEKTYQIVPGKKNRVPVMVATEIQKHPHVASVLEVK